MRSPQFLFACLLASFASFLGGPARAQINPDTTLGAESSIVTPNAEVRGAPADLIEGGAVREAALFHSFTDFNVLASERAYFFNPAGVESILSRITGGDRSNIFGTLGVDGAADLFLLNPNGFVFGPDAELDVPGSLYVTTADEIALGEGGVFSAIAPNQNQFLTVRPNTLFSHYLSANALSANSGDIESQGQINAGENVALVADNIRLEGTVAAGNQLSLLAADTLQVRDTADVPFIAFAGRDLLAQADQQIDIVALSHADSGLFSYGDMVLRSPNAINGDAHYWSGGSFQIQTLDGSPGSLLSPIDPVIRALGDVELETYEGSSLHIVAGGAVRIGSATITALESNTSGIDFLQETVQLSDGTLVAIDGMAELTFDVRAGVSPAAIGPMPTGMPTGLDPAIDTLLQLPAANSPTSANISIGDVIITDPNGTVLLTNQYAPNTQLAEGNIVIQSQLANTLGAGGILAAFNGGGGQVFLDARDDISVIDSVITTLSLNEPGRDIALLAGGDIEFSSPTGKITGTITGSASTAQNSGGNIRVNATNVSIMDGAQFNATTLGPADAGSVLVSAREKITVSGTNPLLGTIRSGVQSRVNPGATGSGSDVVLSASNIEITDFAQIITSANGERSADGAPSNAGNIALNAGDSVMIGSGGELRSDTSTQGNAGNISVMAEGEVLIDDIIFSNNALFPSAIVSSVRLPGAVTSPPGVGNAGEILIDAGSFRLTNGAVIDSGTADRGNANSVTIIADGAVELSGSRNFLVPDGNGNMVPTTRSSAISTSIAQGGIGQGGDINIQADSLNMKDGAQLSTSTFGLRNAENEPSSAGRIGVDVRDSVTLASGAQFRSDTSGEGNAGNISLVAGGAVVIDGIESANGFGLPSGIASSVRLDQPGVTTVGNAGLIEIDAESLSLTNGAVIESATSSQGNAGSVSIETRQGVSVGGTRTLDLLDANGNLVTTTRNALVRTTVDPGAMGQGGKIEVVADSLMLNSGGQLLTGTSGQLSDDGRPSSAGDIVIDLAGDARLTAGGQLRSDTAGQGDAGNISLTAEGDIVLDGVSALNGQPFPSGISSSVIGLDPVTQTVGMGDAGTIQIDGKTLSLTNGAAIDSSTFSEGNAGDVSIVADGAVVIGGQGMVEVTAADGSTAPFFRNSNISTAVGLGNAGQGGSLTIDAGSVRLYGVAQLLTQTFGRRDAEDNLSHAGNIAIRATGDIEVNGASQLRSDTSGQGNAGDITLMADGTVTIDGAEIIGGIVVPSGIASSVLLSVPEQGRLVEGNAGLITVDAGAVNLTNGGTIESATLSRGDSGGVRIVADGDVQLAGSRLFQVPNANGEIVSFTRSSVISTDVNFFAVGQGGSVQIDADALRLNDGAQVLTRTFAQNNENNPLSNAGNITVDVENNLSLQNGALIDSRTAGRGNAGDITLTAGGDALLEGVAVINGSPFQSSVLSQVSRLPMQGILGIGQGGKITLNANSLALRDGATISSSTFGEGDTGNLLIDVEGDIDISGTAAVELNGVTFGYGSGISSQVANGGVGNSALLEVKGESITIDEGGFISTSTGGEGNAGSILLTVADQLTLLDGSSIDSNVSFGGRGNAGEVRVNARGLTLAGGSQIGSSLSRGFETLPAGQGRGGNIQLDVTDFIDISGVNIQPDRFANPFNPTDLLSTGGFSSGVFASAEPGTRGPGGRIAIETGNLRIAEGGVVNAITSNGDAGGDINIVARNLEVASGGQIIATTRNSGQAGSITLDIKNRATFAGFDPTFESRLNQFGSEVVNNQGPESGIFANSTTEASGDGQTINISAGGLSFLDGATLTSQSEGSGLSGDINLEIDRQLLLDNGDISTSARQATAGSIFIDAGTVVLRNDGDIRTNVEGGAGSGGNIDIVAGATVILNDSDILAFSPDSVGGAIDLSETTVFSTNRDFTSLSLGRQELQALDGNGQPDINASGGVASGPISVNDDSFVENELGELTDTLADSDTLLANSCIARDTGSGSFLLTSRDRLSQGPSDPLTSGYSVGDVRPVLPDELALDESAVIDEPQAIYQLTDGRLFLASECSDR